MFGSNSNMQARGVSKVDNSGVIASDKNSEVKKSENTGMTTLAIWSGLIGLYFFWNWIQENKLTESLKLGNIKANFHNIIVVTVGVIIGYGFLKIIFGKMALAKNQYIRRVGEIVLPVITL